MAEPIHVDFRHRRRIYPIETLQSAARTVRMYLDRIGVHDAVVDVVLPDPIRDRSPYIQISMATPDADLEDQIERGWPTIDFDFAWIDAEDLP